MYHATFQEERITEHLFFPNYRLKAKWENRAAPTVYSNKRTSARQREKLERLLTLQREKERFQAHAGTYIKATFYNCYFALNNASFSSPHTATCKRNNGSSS